MALRILSLAISQVQNDYSYSYKTTAQFIINTTPYSISVGKFLKDSGSVASAFITSGLPQLELNGVTQQTGTYKLSPGKVVFKVTAATNGKTVIINTPITLNVYYSYAHG